MAQHNNFQSRNRLKDALQIGERVYIRAPKPRDCDEFLALSRASKNFLKRWLTPATQRQQFAAYLKRCRKPEFEGFLVCRLEDDAILGTINLSQIFRGGFKNAYMGYMIGAPYAGQGYMTEAIQLVLKQAFVKLKLHRIEANIQPDNGPSIALARRAGFRLEGYSRRYLKVAGRWRDHERWAIIAEDWLARKRKPQRHKGHKER
jgi:[ribosomal protein S5]-alanine N-acetyltransferase